MFMMQIKLNHNLKNKLNLKHTTKPQTFKHHQKHQGSCTLTTYFEEEGG